MSVPLPVVIAVAASLVAVALAGFLMWWWRGWGAKPASLQPEQLDPALMSAIREQLAAARGLHAAARYIGDCQQARWPRDIGTVCSLVRPRRDGTVQVTIRDPFAGGILIVMVFGRMAGRWTPIARW